MGEIRKVLVNIELPDRELHNSRLFVDLSENVHMHFRELRSVYSVSEFFEFADIISRSSKDLRRYLLWHPDYREQKNFNNEMIALGPEQQTTPLRKSPKPHKSTYFDNRLQIELQGERVIDEIHIHYRDYRFVVNLETFRIWAGAMNNAVETLNVFLADNSYERIEHPFRREVVKDRYYEARNFENREKTKISVKQRIGGLLFYLGGDRLLKFAKLILQYLK